MPFADVQGRRLFYERRGTGAPLLLIQGMAGHHQIWGDELLDGLGRHFDVVAYDHRGVGESTDVEGPFTIADLASDAAAVLDFLDWPTANVFGISMGGMVAQELAAAHPDRVRSLVLGCTYPGGEGTRIDAPGPLAMLQAMQTGDLDVAMRAAFAANHSPAYVADESNYEPFTRRALAVRLPVPTIMRQAQASATHDASSRLSSITAPTLVIHGTADDMIRYSNGELVAKLIPGATLHTFPDVGHLFWWERPNETLALITDHLGVG